MSDAKVKDDAKIKKVFSDKKFVESLLEMSSAKDVQAALAEKGVKLSEKEIIDVKNQLAKGNGKELSQDQLDGVAGGVVISGTVLAVVACVSGVISLAGKVNEWTRRRW